jgi:ABC-2 type transport system permease protein
MAASINQIKLETKLFLRGKQNLFMTFAFPAILILILGSVLGKQSWSGIPAIDYLLPGIIAMALMNTCMHHNAVKITNEREKGIYRRLSLTPLKKQDILVGNTFVRYLIVLVSTILLIVLGVSIFKATLSINYLLLWFVLTLGALVFIAIGFVLTSLSRNTSSATTLGMAALFPLMFLGGCFWPADQIPAFLRPVCEALPTLHLTNALRLVLVQGAGFNQISSELPVMIGWLIGCTILAVMLFKWE